jgi:hypothetical protein
MRRDQNAGQNRKIEIGNKSFERRNSLNIWETTLVNQNFIHEEIFFFSSSLLSKNVKIKMYRNIILLVVLYDRKT